MLAGHRDDVDWNAMPRLEAEVFFSETSFDALNRPVTLTAPDRSILRPKYNEANLLERLDVSLRGIANFTPFVRSISYNAAGQRESVEYGNGVRTTNTYDPLTFRLIHLSTTRLSDGANLQDLTYAYDPVGNLSSIRDAAQQTIYFQNQVVGANSDYVYDATYRLTRAEGREHAGRRALPETIWDNASRVHQHLPGDGRAMLKYREYHRYDAVGNILDLIHAAAHNGSWRRHYEYGEIETSNRLTKTTSGELTGQYHYDRHGNMTRMPHLTLMTWDFRDQLASTQAQVVNNGRLAQTTYYLYDSLGQRARKVTVDGCGRRRADRIYIGGFEVYREYASDGNSVKLERTTLHVMDDGRRVALVETREEETSIRYQFGNHLGSACLELDEAGAVITYEEYYPYGNTSYQSGRSLAEVSLKRYRFTGKERDDETGFSYHGARYYAPWLGRWVSCDPAGLVDGPNLFAYASDNPIGGIDPSGTQAVDPKKEAPYAEGDDPATGAHERYTVTPDLEANEYVEFPDDTITGSRPHRPKSGGKKTDKPSEGGIVVIAEPFDEEAFLASIHEALQETETPEYKIDRALAAAERDRQLEYEKELADEAQLDKELPGFGASLIPGYGSAASSFVHFSHGNYGRGIAYAVLAVSDVFLVKSLVVGVGKAAVKGAGIGLAEIAGRTGAEKEGLILFGQKRIAPTFRTYSEASELIRGQTIVDVAEGLKSGQISPNELPIDYFVKNGQRIAVNNRGLAALRLAGLEPAVVREVPETAKLIKRLSELPIDRFHTIPGLRQAVTLQKVGTGHLYTVFVQ
jgi:RHS repeat-associated protein